MLEFDQWGPSIRDSGTPKLSHGNSNVTRTLRSSGGGFEGRFFICSRICTHWEIFYILANILYARRRGTVLFLTDNATRKRINVLWLYKYRLSSIKMQLCSNFSSFYWHDINLFQIAGIVSSWLLNVRK